MDTAWSDTPSTNEMPFPPSERVLYGRTPLDEVICELRFPPVLRIDAEAPAAFQDRIRGVFPMYQRGPSAPPISLPPQLAQVLALGGGGAGVHEFGSEDDTWKLSLTKDSIALTTRAYKEWKGFKEKLAPPLAALRDIYAPSFFGRIGLRYRDRIDRDRFGLADVPWAQLVEEVPLGEVGHEKIGSRVRHALRELIIELEGTAGNVRVVHGMERQEDGKSVYLIDSDFFTEARVETEGTDHVLDGFNRRAGHLFRWYITKRLHDAMDPQLPSP